MIVHIGTERLELRPLARCALSPSTTTAQRARSLYSALSKNTTFAFLAAASPPRISDDRKSAPPRGLTHSKRLYSPQKWVERLAYFLEQVPPWIEVAVEFRHPSWHTEEVFSLLERSLCGLVRSFRGGHLRCILILHATGSFVCVRLYNPGPNCTGRPIASRNGKVRDDLCWSTSTTTELEMQFAMLQS